MWTPSQICRRVTRGYMASSPYYLQQNHAEFIYAVKYMLFWRQLSPRYWKMTLKSTWVHQIFVWLLQPSLPTQFTVESYPVVLPSHLSSLYESPKYPRFQASVNYITELFTKIVEVPLSETSSGLKSYKFNLAGNFCLNHLLENSLPSFTAYSCRVAYYQCTGYRGESISGRKSFSYLWQSQMVPLLDHYHHLGLRFGGTAEVFFYSHVWLSAQHLRRKYQDQLWNLFSLGIGTISRLTNS